MTATLGMLTAYVYFHAVWYHSAVSECLLERRLMKKLFIEMWAGSWGPKEMSTYLGTNNRKMPLL